jgi:hypothetical protein
VRPKAHHAAEQETLILTAVVLPIGSFPFLGLNHFAKKEAVVQKYQYIPLITPCSGIAFDQPSSLISTVSNLSEKSYSLGFMALLSGLPTLPRSSAHAVRWIVKVPAVLTVRSNVKMKISLIQRAAVASATLGMLAGCNGGVGSQMPSLVSSGIQQATLGGQGSSLSSIIALTTEDHIVPNVRPNTRKSWMDPDAKNTQYLMYTSDEATGTVNVYFLRTRSGRLAGQLSGFQFPYGECVDAASNVYIADFGAKQIVEYAHGGKTPIKTLRDRYGFPIGCSVDPKTGDLAVSNFEGVGRTCMGGIVIYNDASGRGKLYQDKDFNYYWPPGYDSQGNLYVEGRKKEDKRRGGLAEIPAGFNELVTISLSGARIKSPGGVQWDGHYVTATDQAYQGTHLTGIYRVTVAASQATVVGSSLLSDTCLKGKVPYNDVVQPYMTGTSKRPNTIIGGNLACDYRFDFWAYTRGGDPRKVLPSDTAPQLSAGQTVSAMQKQKS